MSLEKITINKALYDYLVADGKRLREIESYIEETDITYGIKTILYGNQRVDHDVCTCLETEVVQGCPIHDYPDHDSSSPSPDEGADDLPEEMIVTVCDKCLLAACWQGIFMCGEAKNAGTTERTVKELRKLNLENQCYWTGGRMKEKDERVNDPVGEEKPELCCHQVDWKFIERMATGKSWLYSQFADAILWLKDAIFKAENHTHPVVNQRIEVLEDKVNRWYDSMDAKQDNKE